MGVKLSDYVMRFIADQGVRHVFMVPGGGAMHLNDSLGHCDGLEYICDLHEQASAIAAEAYARVTNNLGVALVTSGPGCTNAITGLTGAWLDSTPCLFLSGQVKRSDLKGDSGVRQLGVQETDTIALVKPVTKYAVMVTDPASIRYHLEKAVHLARTSRPGPAWLDIPLDVQAAVIEPSALQGFTPAPELDPRTQQESLEAQIRVAAELLNGAERPVILAGNGIRLAGAEEAFLRMVDFLRIPVLTTRLGVDLIAADHNQCFGMPGTLAPRGANIALQNSDWLLILGARLDMALLAYAPKNLARAAKKIMVNIDPAEIAKLGSIIDVPVSADAGAFIAGLLDHADWIENRDRTSWLTRCNGWRQEYPFVLPEHRSQDGPVSVYAFSAILAELLHSDCIILPGNAGNACEIFLTAFAVKQGQRVFHNKGTGAMGFSQPAAIGACLAGDKRPTVCVDGDGGFQMNIQELETVRRLALPIKFFVMNNQGYASIRASQKGYFGRLTGADASSGLSLPDVTEVASAYGLATARIPTNRGLEEQIRRVLEMPGPVVCDVTIVPDEPRIPRVASKQRADGSMVSSALEDMWPFLDRQEFRSNMIVPPLDDA